MQARPGSRPTRVATATTPGRSPSTRTTPTAGTCRRAPDPSPPTAAATRKRVSTGGATASPGSRSPARVACTPVSLTASSGRAATTATVGLRFAWKASRLLLCSASQAIRELRPRPDPELPEHLAQVVLDRAWADEELRGDFAIRVPIGHEPGD